MKMISQKNKQFDEMMNNVYQKYRKTINHKSKNRVHKTYR